MRSAVNQAVLLLLLGVIVSDADPEDCGALARPFHKGDIDVIVGDWVLVWAEADSDLELVGKISTSHVALRRLDNSTVEFDEKNVYLSNITSCTEYSTNMTIAESENLTLHSEVIKKETDGVVQHYNESADIDFYRSCPDCLLLVYKASQSGRYVLSYRKDGHHRDVDEQKAAHELLNKFVECLKFPKEKPYVYDGVSDFCHKKSAPEVKAEES